MQPRVDLPPAVFRQTTVPNMMPEKCNVEDQGQDQTKGGKDPDYQRKKHAEEDSGLLSVFVRQDLDIDEELNNRRMIFRRRVLSDRNKVGLQD